MKPSKSLYNRSQYEINLQEFNILETKEFLKKRSDREAFDAYLTIGGVPEYLKWVNKDSSVFLSLCKNSFTKDSFFSREYEKIFTSNMSGNKYYKNIIKILSKKKFINRNELSQTLKISPDGNLSKILIDLEKSCFICKYYPFNLNENTILTRYTIKESPGYQIDLIFDQTDNVCTICEIKYLQTKVSTKIIDKFKKKLSLFLNKANKTIHKVLICSEGAETTLLNKAYFDNIITCKQLLNANNWNL